MIPQKKLMYPSEALFDALMEAERQKYSALVGKLQVHELLGLRQAVEETLKEWADFFLAREAEEYKRTHPASISNRRF
jgi:hypothetical protein